VHSFKRRFSLLGALILCCSASAHAEPAQQPPAISPFIQCDGAKGHVGILGKIGEVVAITATAGLAGDAINPNPNDLEKKLAGKPGAVACDIAIGQEDDPIRRSQLGIARTIHLVEANDLSAALASARQIRSLVPESARDWAYEISIGSSAKYLEASILARLGRAQEAEDAAIQSAALAPFDLLALDRAAPFMQLTTNFSPAKSAYYEHLIRMEPDKLEWRAEAYAWSENFASAANDIADYDDIFRLFAPQREIASGLALEAIYRNLAGDRVRANALYEEAKASFDQMIASGAARGDANRISNADEKLSFYKIVDALDRRSINEARTAFAARDHWIQIPPAIVEKVSTELVKDAPKSERHGALADDPGSIRHQNEAAILALLQRPELVHKLYQRTGNVVKISDYTRMSGSVWKIGERPRMLMRNPPKELLGAAVVDARLAGYGTLAAGEAVLLHSALIAKQRGDNCFVLMPGRNEMAWAPVRFGKIGSPGFSASATYAADAVIAALSKHIPPPQPN
jgi:hypothetical protein